MDATPDAPPLVGGPSYTCVPTFQSVQAISEPGSEAIAEADFNGDGHLDLITCNTTSDELALLLADGAGGFQSPNFLATGSGSQPMQVRTADLDGDTHADAVSANFAGASITVFLGHGDATFTSASYPLGWSPYDAALGDINGDGKLDIVAIGSARLGDAEITVLANDGTGTYSTYAALTPSQLSSTTPESVELADFDGDGSLDIAVGTFSASVCIFLNNGGGSFAAPICSATSSGGTWRIAVADFDGDGHMDVAATEPPPESSAVNWSVGPLEILFGRGDGTLEPPIIERSVSNAGPLAVADVDGDGKPDIVAQQLQSTEASVLRNLGNRTFTSTTYGGVMQSSGSINGLGQGIAVGDLDGDGHVDLALSWAGSLETTLGHGDGTFSLPSLHYFGAPTLGGALADLDGDGNLDAVFAASGIPYEPAIVPIMYGNGDGTFTDQPVFLRAPYYSGAPRVSVADVTGDGKPDILLADVYGLVLLKNQGNRQFALTSTVDWPVNFFPDAVVNGADNGANIAVGDVNNDGLPDLVGANGTVDVALGQGNDLFTVPISTDVPNTATGLAALGDFDRDGKLDAVVYSSNGPLLMRGRGDGTFTPSTQIDNQLCNFVAAPLRDVGVLDLVGVECQDDSINQIRISLGVGDGTFISRIAYNVANTHVESVMVADVDGDSLPDIIALGWDYVAVSTSLGILRNEGNGNFAPAVTYPSVAPAQVLVGDFNGDSHSDILIVDTAGDVIPALEACTLQ